MPFTGAGPATNALLSGQVDYMCDGVPESGSYIQARMLKAYAVGTAERNPAIPNVPTSKEAGLPEFQAAPWFTLFTPKGTPQSVRDTLMTAANVKGE